MLLMMMMMKKNVHSEIVKRAHLRSRTRNWTSFLFLYAVCCLPWRFSRFTVLLYRINKITRMKSNRESRRILNGFGAYSCLHFLLHTPVSAFMRHTVLTESFHRSQSVVLSYKANKSHYWICIRAFEFAHNRDQSTSIYTYTLHHRMLNTRTLDFSVISWSASGRSMRYALLLKSAQSLQLVENPIIIQAEAQTINGYSRFDFFFFFK